ncbi:MAG: hypothetical protein AAF721_16085, partial [Myxococcota bacterium]
QIELFEHGLLDQELVSVEPQPAGATAGGGYAVRAESRECEPVRYTESPEMFIPGGEGTLDPKRGNITICQDCIQASSCDELLEGALGVR